MGADERYVILMRAIYLLFREIYRDHGKDEAYLDQVMKLSEERKHEILYQGEFDPDEFMDACNGLNLSMDTAYESAKMIADFWNEETRTFEVPSTKLQRILKMSRSRMYGDSPGLIVGEGNEGVWSLGVH